MAGAAAFGSLVSVEDIAAVLSSIQNRWSPESGGPARKCCGIASVEEGKR